MKALIQRVSEARVDVDGSTVGAIDQGLLILLGVEPNDTEETVAAACQKLTRYRLFSDHDGKMNLSVKEVGGSILLVSQFTLAGDTRKGLRPSFSRAAKPDLANDLYEKLARAFTEQGVRCETGQFAADMKVSLVNDGPVTFMLEFS
jgi:D-tyrosyl-tRNA(Tyr) deacylase